MAKYKYNDVILPALPEWDKEAYPFAVITDDNCLHVHEFPIVVNYSSELGTTPFITCAEGISNGYYYTYNAADDTWEAPVSKKFGREDDGIHCVSSVLPIWSNHVVFNVFNGLNTVYLTGSEPVSVEDEDTGGDDNTGDDNTGGDTEGDDTTGGDNNEGTDPTPEPEPDPEPEPEPEIPLDKTPILAELYITKGRKLYQIGGASNYSPISITSFSNNAGTKEYGQVVTGLSLSWALNKKAKTLTLDGDTLDVSTTSKTLSGLSITHDANKTWTLVATDEKNASASKTTTVSFANGVYYGASAEPAEYNSAFILGLTKRLQNSKVTPFTVNAGAGQYIYYALPKRLGTCVFTVGVLPGGFDLAATIAFENAHGYTEDYYIYKSDNANLGSTTVNVS